MPARNPQGKYGRHLYSRKEFGLTAEGVRAHFAEYWRAYGTRGVED